MPQSEDVPNLITGWDKLTNIQLVELKNALDYWMQSGKVIGSLLNDPLCSVNSRCERCPAGIVKFKKLHLCSVLMQKFISLNDIYELVEYEMDKREDKLCSQMKSQT